MKISKIFKGFWERWKNLTNQNVAEMMQYFKELEVFLRRIFTNRISLSDNIYCRFFEVSNVTANMQTTLENVILNPREQTIDAILLSQTSDPCHLTWVYTSGVNISYTLHTSAVSTIPSATLLVFYKDTSNL